MVTNLISKVEAEDGTFIVVTKSRYLGFFAMPHSSIMPYDVKKFVVAPGFQIHYTTSDPKVLAKWHNMLTSMIGKGLFEALSDGTHVGYFPYPEDKKHLEKYVKRFV
jgi:hypothetical protein